MGAGGGGGGGGGSGGAEGTVLDTLAFFSSSSNFLAAKMNVTILGQEYKNEFEDTHLAYLFLQLE